MEPVYRNIIFLCLFFLTVGCVWHVGSLSSYVNLLTIKNNQQFLQNYIEHRPILSASLYMLITFMLTLLAFPVTLVMVTIGGFLFGTFLASMYSFCALLASSVCIFKFSKSIFGSYIQETYAHKLRNFNKNFHTYGVYYLILIRALPVMPFFAINFAAGLMHVPLKTFIVSMALGALPTIIFCSYLGSQCASIVVNW